MEDTILVHHGIKGQEWGDRRYQNEDGSLTPLGRIHYGVGEARDKSKIKMREEKAKMKNEIRIAKAKAKAEAYKVKAEAKAYKMKKRADTEAERDRIKAEKEVEKSRIEAEREAARDVSRENREIAREENQTRKELAEIEANKEKNNIKTGIMAAAGVLAAAGIGYLIYKNVKGKDAGAAIDTTSQAVSKAKDVVDKVKDSPVKDIIEKVTSKTTNKDKTETPKVEKEDKTNHLTKPDVNTDHKSGVSYKVGVNSDGSTKVITKMSRDKFGAKKRVEAAYRKVEASNDKVKASNKKTRYVFGPSGDYYKQTRNADGTYTETASKPTSAKNIHTSNTFKRFYNQIYGKKKIRHYDENEGIILVHHGIKGQRWGHRRWQYEDGTLTPEGREHYGRLAEKLGAKVNRAGNTADSMTTKMAQTVTNEIASNTAKAIMAGVAGGFGSGTVIGAVAGLSVVGLFALTKKINEKRLEKVEKLLAEAEKKPVDEFLKNKEANPDYTDKEVNELKKQGYKFLDADEDPEENRRGPFKYENLKEFYEKDPEGYRKSIYGKAEEAQNIAENKKLYKQLNNAKNIDEYVKIRDKLVENQQKSGKRYSMDFQELVQNDKRQYSTEWMDKESAKYNADPKKYWDEYKQKMEDPKYRKKYQE